MEASHQRAVGRWMSGHDREDQITEDDQRGTDVQEFRRHQEILGLAGCDIERGLRIIVTKSNRVIKHDNENERGNTERD